MLLLYSDGLSSKSLRSALAERLRNCRSAALVVTADNEYKKQNHHVPRCMDELKALGLSVALFDLDTHPCRRRSHDPFSGIKKRWNKFQRFLFCLIPPPPGGDFPRRGFRTGRTSTR